jgi:hypothetical protein
MRTADAGKQDELDQILEAYSINPTEYKKYGLERSYPHIQGSGVNVAAGCGIVNKKLSGKSGSRSLRTRTKPRKGGRSCNRHPTTLPCSICTSEEE